MKIDPIRMFLPIQLGMAACAMPVVAFAPPAHGRILFVPILPGSGAHLAADLIDRGGQLVATGPFAGSLVVEGDRDRLTPGLLSRGVVPVSTTLMGCGDPQQEGVR